ncbi:integrase core domain-containing protein [Pararhodobacter oceanensis]|uniref:integrase core domain-containing protein n=1 Tax=Pararhodobacter oceanensis TaxID=2172121 RepID=UPI003A8D526F
MFDDRLWRTLLCGCVYLQAWESGSEAKAGIRKSMTFYHHTRPHTALGSRPPAKLYWLRANKVQVDQQVQRIAKITPSTAQ